jgi:hypothetical protein
MTLIELAYHLRPYIEKAAQSLTDADALEAVQLYPAWTAGESYEPETRVRHGGKLWRCEQAHTAQADWTPDATPALWTEVAKPGEIPVWKQPTGAQDAYMIGDKVHYPDKDGPVYISTVDNNVWQPGVYGWELME